MTTTMATWLTQLPQVPVEHHFTNDQPEAQSCETNDAMDASGPGCFVARVMHSGLSASVAM